MLIVLLWLQSQPKLINHSRMSRFQADGGRSCSANMTGEPIAKVHRPATDHELQETLHGSHFNGCDIGRQFQFQVQLMSFQNEKRRRHASTAVKHPKRWNPAWDRALAILRPSLRTIYTIIFNIFGLSLTDCDKDFKLKNIFPVASSLQWSALVKIELQRYIKALVKCDGQSLLIIKSSSFSFLGDN